MPPKYWTHTKHVKERVNRAKSGIHAMMEIPLKYKVINGRRYALKMGNLKISGNTIIFNLPPIKTCPGKGECVEYCYSEVKVHGKFKTVREARARNYKHSLRPTFVTDMQTIIKNLTEKYTYIKAVRIHEAGDFYDQDYLHKWVLIATEFPQIIFYAYTKSWFVQKEDLPENFIVWYSHGGKWDEKYRKEDNQAVVIKPGEQAPEGYFVCPTIGNPDKVCGRDCSYCIQKGTGRRIAFPMH